MKAITLVIPGFVALMSGCLATTMLVPMDIDGSKADGTIVMGVGGVNWSTKIDWNKAGVNAAFRCRSWGYEGARPFTGLTKKCVDRGEILCLEYEVRRKYQCTGTTKE